MVFRLGLNVVPICFVFILQCLTFFVCLCYTLYNGDYAVLLYHQAKPFDLTLLLRSVDTGVDPSGVDAGVSQNICQPTDILGCLVVQAGKQVPQVVGKYFPDTHIGLFAQCFHPMKNIASVHRFPASGYKDASTADSTLSGIPF